jgi:hypothetical protein
VVWVVGAIAILLIAAFGVPGLLSIGLGKNPIRTPLEENLPSGTATTEPNTQVAETTLDLVVPPVKSNPPELHRTPTDTAPRPPTSTPKPRVPSSDTPEPSVDLSLQTRPTYFPLDQCAGSRLREGDWAYVAFGGGRNAIRNKPDVGDKSNKIGFAEEGEVVTIVGGPVCSYTWIVWKVRSSDGLQGWTPEGDGQVFWLVPGLTSSPCAQAPPSRLQTGQLAEVSLYPDVPNNVRQNPDLDAKLLGKIQPGEVVKIREGPACADGLVWWRVRSQRSTLAGWTAEGDADDYWLVPILEE